MSSFVYFLLDTTTFFKKFKESIVAYFLDLYTCTTIEQFDFLFKHIISTLAFRRLYFKEGTQSKERKPHNDLELSIQRHTTALVYFPRYNIHESFAFVWEYMRDVMNFEFLTLSLVDSFEATVVGLLEKLRKERFS